MRLRKIALGIVVCTAAFFTAYSMVKFTGQTKMFIVKTIEVKNNSKVSSSDVLALSGIHCGMRMQECNVRASEKSIGSIPWVRTVHVVRHYPSTVRITIEERIPVAVEASGQVHFIDKDGALLPFLPDAPIDLPVVTGLNSSVSGQKVDSTDIARLISFLSDASNYTPGLFKRISQIDFSNKSILRIKLANSAMLMELSSSGQRVGLMRLEKLLDIMSRTSQTEPQKLNVCFSNMAYAQW
jgi:cell division septal protein FtsQ